MTARPSVARPNCTDMCDYLFTVSQLARGWLLHGLMADKFPKSPHICARCCNSSAPICLGRCIAAGCMDSVLLLFLFCWLCSFAVILFFYWHTLQFICVSKSCRIHAILPRVLQWNQGTQHEVVVMWQVSVAHFFMLFVCAWRSGMHASMAFAFAFDSASASVSVSLRVNAFLLAYQLHLNAEKFAFMHLFRNENLRHVACNICV